MSRSLVPDVEIDRLFQLPLAEFTAARNALAKQFGSAGGPIRQLTKPNLPAWAVNQLFWKTPVVFKKLMAAEEARRAAHAKRLVGQRADIAGTEALHGAALRAAADEIRALLGDAGEAPTAATMNAVTETLQALPGAGRPGRLTRPLKLAGFEALAGIVPASPRTLRALTPAPASASAGVKTRAQRAGDDPRAGQRQAAADKREEDRRRREGAAVGKALREARAAARTAEAALAAARKTLARARAERERLQDQVQFAMKSIDDAAADVRERERQVGHAGQELTHLEAKLAALRPAD